MSDEKTNHQHHDRRAGVSAGILAALLVFPILSLVLAVKVHSRDAQVADLQKQLADSKSQASKAQADLDKASSGTDDLKAQLAKALGAEDDLKAQLGRDALVANQQQAQVDKDKALQADLQARLDRSDAQSAAFKSQLDQTTAGSAQMLTELNQAKIQTLDLQARLQKAEADIAQLQPMLLKARHMPVAASFEKTRGDRLTLHVNNLDQQPVTVSVAIDDAGKTRSQSNVIGAGATLSIEKISAGDRVTVSSDGYDPLKLTAQ